ncbi:thioredoxin domain-containing protein [Isoalcanivorax pacificus W11-5]|uniref:Thioredoxin domain-containing protein n=1 Tax=Isoalcanivorax pacificus W11-5 TaxID=391936 RepID=A0A0B4XNL1_9GAMM|nr:tetratricopeptide repeat protein [Isoalcanivorax pacificus]AJD47882.1 thioredoxin domain-containing protein [Isoalcanivorax pacificus W11-5]
MQAEQFIIDVTEHNLTEVLEASRRMPVIVDFWADWCQPCQQMAPVLEKIVREQAGRVLLAKVNADQQQVIAGQFGVRSLPTLKLVYQGQLVAELSGLQTEAALRQWLAPVLGNPEEDEAAQEEAFLEQVRGAIAAGHGEQAEAVLRQTLAQEPDRHSLRALLVEYLLGDGRVQDAQSVLAEVAEDVDTLRPFRARFALLEEFAEAPVPLSELARQIDQPESPEKQAAALYTYGLQAAAAGQFRDGLEALLRLLRDHPGYREGVARAALLKVFDCLPKGDPLASEYRRKMFNYLY